MARKKKTDSMIKAVPLPESDTNIKDTWNPAELNEETKTKDTWNPAVINEELKRFDSWNPAELNSYLTNKYNLEAVHDADIDDNTAHFVTLEPSTIQEIDYDIDQETGTSSQAILQSATMPVPGNNSPYIYRPNPADSTGRNFCYQTELIGGSVVWNQMVDTTDTSVTVPSGHKYIHWNGTALSLDTSDGTAITVVGGTDKIYDITQMFGTSVANQMTTAKFSELFPDYANYAYSANTIQSVKVASKKVVGFNQWDEEWEVGRYDDSGNPVSSNLNVRTKNPIKVFPNTAYCFYSETGRISHIYWYDSNDNFIRYDSNSVQVGLITSPSNAYYCRFRFPDSYGNTYKNDSCVNISSSKNGTYEPYTSTTYDLSGSHVVNRKYGDYTVTNDTIFGSFTANAEYGAWARITNIGVQKIDNADICAESNKAIGVSYNNRVVNPTDRRIFIDETGYVVLRASTSDNITTVEQLKTLFMGAEIIYKKATETTETVTNPTLYGIPKLDSNNNLYYDGDTVSDIPNVQVIETGGTQEYVDAEVEAETRDVAIPAGGQEYYLNNITVVTVPDPPETLTSASVSIDNEGIVTITDTSGEEPATYTTSIDMPDTLQGDNYLTVVPGNLTGVKYTRIQPKIRRTKK